MPDRKPRYPTHMGRWSVHPKLLPRLRCILAGALTTLTVLALTHWIGVHVVRWRHPEGSGR